MFYQTVAQPNYCQHNLVSARKCHPVLDLYPKCCQKSIKSSQLRNGDGIDVFNNSPSGTAASTAVFRFATYDVRERLTATRTLLGSAKLSVADLVASGNVGH